MSAAQRSTPPGDGSTPDAAGVRGRLSDVERTLVRLAAIVAVSDESAVRVALTAAHRGAVPIVWVEELLLQSYIFAGFPRALNAMREWRRVSGVAAPPDDVDSTVEAFVARGERTCAHVYGRFYDRLRRNVAALHPALDRWMVEVGYGQVLGRPNLDLARRELCIVAVCAAAAQDRQLQSHLHGAVHVGVSADAIGDTLDTVADLTPDHGDTARRLWAHVRDTARAVV